MDKLEGYAEECTDCTKASAVRGKLKEVGDRLGDLCSLLTKDPTFPDYEDMLQR